MDTTLPDHDSIQNDLEQSPAAEQCNAHGQGQGHPQLTLTMEKNDPNNMNNTTENKTDPGSEVRPKPEVKAGAMDTLDTENRNDKDRHSSGASSDSRNATSSKTNAAVNHINGSQTGSDSLTGKNGAKKSPKRLPHTNHNKIDAAKQKDKEERLKHAKERASQERKKKLVDLQEAQRKAQDFRKKQEEDRRRKLEEMKKKEEYHRNLVEERRKKLLDEDTSRKQQIIRRSVERDAKLDRRTTQRTTGGGLYAFGSRSALPRMASDVTADGPRRAVSQGNLLRAAPPRASADDSRMIVSPNRAVSACNLASPSGGVRLKHSSNLQHGHLSAEKKTQSSLDLHSSRVSGTSSAPTSRPPPHKRLSMSTTHLVPKARVSKVGANDSLVAGSVNDLNTTEDATPPMRPTKSSHSDIAMSASSDGSPIRRPRPHSVAGRLPSYASPTVASQIRTSRSTEKKSSGSVSPGPKMRSKSADYRRSRADIQRTFERLSTPRTKPKEVSQDSMSRSFTSTPPKSTPTPPRPMVPRSLPKDTSLTKPTAASANKGVTPTKPKTPVGKESSPLKEPPRERATSKERVTKERAADKPSSAVKNKAPPKEKPAPIKEKAAAPKEKPSVKLPPQKTPVKAPTPTKEKVTVKQQTPAKDNKTLPKDKPSAGKDKTQVKTPAKESQVTKQKAVPKEATPAKEKAVVKEKSPIKEDVITKEKSSTESLQKQPAATTERPAEGTSPADQKPATKEPEKKTSPEPTAAAAAPPAAAAPKKEMSQEDEYRAKLAERRRLAREKAEREAEEERLRQEELKRQEEERQRREEEEERRQMEEQMKLAEEARKAEEERLQKAIEAEDRRKKEEAERMEAERIAKEEAEKAAQEEAERKEKERVERMKKEEEERQVRKKRLEMIMKRVKTDDGAPKVESPGSPSKSIAVTPPKESSPTEDRPPPEETMKEVSVTPVEEASPEADTPVATTPSEEQPPLPGSEITPTAPIPAPRSASPAEDSAPKFKSPLLQQMLGKNRNKGSEPVVDTKSEVSNNENEATSVTDIQVDVSKEGGSEMAETARNLVDDVVTKAAETVHTDNEAEQVQEETCVENVVTDSVESAPTTDTFTTEAVSEQNRPAEEATNLVDVSSTEAVSASSPGVLESESFTKESHVPHDEDKDVDTSSQRDFLNNYDSATTDLSHSDAAGTATTTSSVVAKDVSEGDNVGLVNGYNGTDVEMEDSIPRDSRPINGTEGPKTTSGADHFEELIDLSIDNKNVHASPGGDSSQLIKFDADLINSNAPENEPPLTSPLIAFEENTTMKENIQGSTGAGEKEGSTIEERGVEIVMTKEESSVCEDRASVDNLTRNESVSDSGLGNNQQKTELTKSVIVDSADMLDQDRLTSDNIESDMIQSEPPITAERSVNTESAMTSSITTESSELHKDVSEVLPDVMTTSMMVTAEPDVTSSCENSESIELPKLPMSDPMMTSMMFDSPLETELVHGRDISSDEESKSSPVDDEPKPQDSSVLTDRMVQDPMMASVIMDSPIVTETVKEDSMMASVIMDSPIVTDTVKEEDPMMTSVIMDSPIITDTVKKEDPMMASVIMDSPIVTDTVKEEDPMMTSVIMDSPIVTETVKEDPMMTSMIMDSPIVTDNVKEDSMMASMIMDSPIVTDTVEKEDPMMTSMIMESPIVTDTVKKEDPMKTSVIMDSRIVTDTVKKEDPMMTSMIMDSPIVTDNVKEDPMMTSVIMDSPIVTDTVKKEDPMMTSMIMDSPIVTDTVKKEDPMMTSIIMDSPIVTDTVKKEDPMMTSVIMDSPIVTDTVKKEDSMTASIIMDSAIVTDTVKKEDPMMTSVIMDSTDISQNEVTNDSKGNQEGETTCLGGEVEEVDTHPIVDAPAIKQDPMMMSMIADSPIETDIQSVVEDKTTVESSPELLQEGVQNQTEVDVTELSPANSLQTTEEPQSDKSEVCSKPTEQTVASLDVMTTSTVTETEVVQKGSDLSSDELSTPTATDPMSTSMIGELTEKAKTDVHETEVCIKHKVVITKSTEQHLVDHAEDECDAPEAEGSYQQQGASANSIVEIESLKELKHLKELESLQNQNKSSADNAAFVKGHADHLQDVESLADSMEVQMSDREYKEYTKEMSSSEEEQDSDHHKPLILDAMKDFLEGKEDDLDDHSHRTAVTDVVSSEDELDIPCDVDMPENDDLSSESEPEMINMDQKLVLKQEVETEKSQPPAVEIVTTVVRSVESSAVASESHMDTDNTKSEKVTYIDGKVAEVDASILQGERTLIEIPTISVQSEASPPESKCIVPIIDSVPCDAITQNGSANDITTTVPARSDGPQETTVVTNTRREVSSENGTVTVTTVVTTQSDGESTVETTVKQQEMSNDLTGPVEAETAAVESVESVGSKELSLNSADASHKITPEASPDRNPVSPDFQQVEVMAAPEPEMVANYVDFFTKDSQHIHQEDELFTEGSYKSINEERGPNEEMLDGTCVSDVKDEFKSSSEAVEISDSSERKTTCQINSASVTSREDVSLPSFPEKKEIGDTEGSVKQSPEKEPESIEAVDKKEQTSDKCIEDVQLVNTQISETNIITEMSTTSEINPVISQMNEAKVTVNVDIQQPTHDTDVDTGSLGTEIHHELSEDTKQLTETHDKLSDMDTGKPVIDTHHIPTTVASTQGSVSESALPDSQSRIIEIHTQEKISPISEAGNVIERSDISAVSTDTIPCEASKNIEDVTGAKETIKIQSTETQSPSDVDLADVQMQVVVETITDSTASMHESDQETRDTIPTDQPSVKENEDIGSFPPKDLDQGTKEHVATENAMFDYGDGEEETLMVMTETAVVSAESVDQQTSSPYNKSDVGGGHDRDIPVEISEMSLEEHCMPSELEQWETQGRFTEELFAKSKHKEEESITEEGGATCGPSRPQSFSRTYIKDGVRVTESFTGDGSEEDDYASDSSSQYSYSPVLDLEPAKGLPDEQYDPNVFEIRVEMRDESGFSTDELECEEHSSDDVLRDTVTCIDSDYQKRCSSDVAELEENSQQLQAATSTLVHKVLVDSVHECVSENPDLRNGLSEIKVDLIKTEKHISVEAANDLVTTHQIIEENTKQDDLETSRLSPLLHITSQEQCASSGHAGDSVDQREGIEDSQHVAAFEEGAMVSQTVIHQLESDTEPEGRGRSFTVVTEEVQPRSSTTIVEEVSSSTSEDKPDVRPRSSTTVEEVSSPTSEHIPEVRPRSSTTVEEVPSSTSEDLQEIRPRSSTTVEEVSSPTSEHIPEVRPRSSTRVEEVPSSTSEDRSSTTVEEVPSSTSEDLPEVRPRSSTTVEEVSSPTSEHLPEVRARSFTTVEEVSSPTSEDLLEVRPRSSTTVEEVSSSSSEHLPEVRPRSSTTVEEVSSPTSEDLPEARARSSTTVEEVSSSSLEHLPEVRPGSSTTVEEVSSPTSEDLSEVRPRSSTTVEEVSSSSSEHLPEVRPGSSTTVEEVSSPTSEDLPKVRPRSSTTVEEVSSSSSEDLLEVRARSFTTMKEVSSPTSEDLPEVRPRSSTTVEEVSSSSSEDLLEVRARSFTTMEEVSSPTSEDLPETRPRSSTTVEEVSSSTSELERPGSVLHNRTNGAIANSFTMGNGSCIYDQDSPDHTTVCIGSTPSTTTPTSLSPMVQPSSPTQDPSSHCCQTKSQQQAADTSSITDEAMFLRDDIDISEEESSSFSTETVSSVEYVPHGLGPSEEMGSPVQTSMDKVSGSIPQKSGGDVTSSGDCSSSISPGQAPQAHHDGEIEDQKLDCADVQNANLPSPQH